MVESPYFYFPSLANATGSAILDDVTRHHVVTVLRMQPNQKIMLMDGVGNVAEGIIQEASKKTLSVLLGDKIAYPNSTPRVTIAISVLKNANRFGWYIGTGDPSKPGFESWHWEYVLGNVWAPPAETVTP